MSVAAGLIGAFALKLRRTSLVFALAAVWSVPSSALPADQGAASEKSAVERACEAGEVAACLNAGRILIQLSGEARAIRARDMFARGCELGSADACHLLVPMLIEGRKRAEAEQMADSLDWVVGDAMALPFADNTFDVYTISFGIRNVTRPAEALAEAYRVLRPGGRLMVLEFSQIPNDMMQKVYDLYSFNIIPRMGQVIANDRDSYQYLVESIRRFPDQETFAGMIRTAGFEQVKYLNLTMGIAALHSGWKI